MLRMRGSPASMCLGPCDALMPAMPALAESSSASRAVPLCSPSRVCAGRRMGWVPCAAVPLAGSTLQGWLRKMLPVDCGMLWKISVSVSFHS